MSSFSFLNPSNTLGLNKKQQRRIESPRPPRSPVTTQDRVAPISRSSSTLRHDPNTGRLNNRMFSAPVEGYRLSSPYGNRTHPVTGRASNHTGLDFAVGQGSPIYAPRGGIIEEANANDSIYGNQVIMRNGPKLQSMYGHMDKFIVEQGQKVKRGDVLGYVGSTGLSTGPHLHWETWKNGNPVDPSSLMDPKLPRRLPRKPKEDPRQHNLFKTITSGLPDMSDEPDSDLMQVLNPNKMLPRQKQPHPQQPQYGQNDPVRNPQLRAFLKGISDQESGGNYNAVGVDTGGGHRAYGKYQIMDFNIEGPDGWDQEALGRNIDIEQFLNDPKIQEKIARAKLRSYFKQYGPEGAAKAWYAGPGNANTNSNSPQYGGPSINNYAQSVMNHMQTYL